MEFNPPPGNLLSPVSGSHHLCVVVKTDGSVYFWGELGFESKDIPSQIPDLHDICYSSCGFASIIVLSKEGYIYGWGTNSDGQLGLGSITYVAEPTRISDLTKINYISSGSSHSIATDSDGNIYTWGKNTNGQLGTGDFKSKDSPFNIKSLSNITYTACGNDFTLCIDLHGNLYGFGKNVKGELGLGSSNLQKQINTPTLVPFECPFIFISCGSEHSLGLDGNGNIYSWGNNSAQQLGLGNNINTNQPTLIPFISNIYYISCGGSHCAATTNQGDIYTWGGNFFGQLGIGNNLSQSKPILVPNVPPCYFITCAGSHTKAVDINGNLYTWGSMKNSFEQSISSEFKSARPTLIQEVKLARNMKTKSAAKRVR